MKKLLLGSFLVFSSLMSAQLFLQLENTRIGVIGGPNYSRVRNAHNPSAPRYSFYGGLLALIPLDYENQFYIQPQVEYLSSGEKGKDLHFMQITISVCLSTLKGILQKVEILSSRLQVLDLLS